MFSFLFPFTLFLLFFSFFISPPASLYYPRQPLPPLSIRISRTSCRRSPLAQPPLAGALRYRMRPPPPTSP
jgi:hypothetical protein